MTDLPIYLPAPDVAKMTSLEIVDFINDVREKKAKREGMTFPCKKYTNLAHKNFLAKVPKVLHEEHSAKFLAQYKDTTGRTLNCYKFPRREACLMAMSYDYDAQAKVFDRMNELEGLVNFANLSDQDFHDITIQEQQHRLVLLEERSFKEHGQKGSALMIMRKKEKQQIEAYSKKVKELSQLTLPGFNDDYDKIA